MNLIVETDLGHDPDDLFTLLYLIATGVDIKLLLVHPGDLDQLAVASFIRDELELDLNIVANKESSKFSSGGIHHELLKKYKRPLEYRTTTFASGNIDMTLRGNPDSEFFIIGPPKGLGSYIKTSSYIINRMTMQGGFLPYTHHTFPAKQIEKFVGQQTVPTFNMNGAVEETKNLVQSDKIKHRQFVGKNVCHTIIFDKARLDKFTIPNSRAAELFVEAARLYFNKHSEKKFHDPVCAACHLHPELGDWVLGKPYRERGQWGTALTDNGDNILANLDEEAFWECITHWK